MNFWKVLDLPSINPSFCPLSLSPSISIPIWRLLLKVTRSAVSLSPVVRLDDYGTALSRCSSG
ncbi:hypothetical protein RchiOBHm_Chr4g0401301 [Rosa chinensis]|uniref:Uncharacterized protein n=1 Tax=Rosa chinensis TaxID=74649 RepID=A0A2P6QT16_ROSCH|nr:hypothetical protein RchiOBHm_Chr4g0401301 [Rosa chinensis]